MAGPRKERGGTPLSLPVQSLFELLDEYRYDLIVIPNYTIRGYLEERSIGIYSRGLSYAEVSDYQKANKDFSRAIELNRKNANAYYNRAVMFGKVGDREKGWEDMKMCARLGDAKARDLLRSKGIKW